MQNDLFYLTHFSFFVDKKRGIEKWWSNLLPSHLINQLLADHKQSYSRSTFQIKEERQEMRQLMWKENNQNINWNLFLRPNIFQLKMALVACALHKYSQFHFKYFSHCFSNLTVGVPLEPDLFALTRYDSKRMLFLWIDQYHSKYHYRSHNLYCYDE